MGNLNEQEIKETFKQLLNIGSSNAGLTNTLKSITDGAGIESPIKVSTDALQVTKDVTLDEDLAVTGNSTITGNETVSGTFTADGAVFRHSNYFLAYASSAQSITTSTQTDIEYDTVSLDSASDFNTSTYTYTPSVAGVYIIIARFRIDNLGDGKTMILRLLKNGVAAIDQDDKAAGALDDISAQCFGISFFNGTTDNIKAQIFHNEGSNLNSRSGSSNTWFAGFRLGPLIV